MKLISMSLLLLSLMGFGPVYGSTVGTGCANKALGDFGIDAKTRTPDALIKALGSGIGKGKDKR